MARNRKRAKERQSRRPPGAGRPQDAGVATARPGRDDTPPSPIEHATPDVDIAEAQLALGRPELAGDQTPAEIEALTEAEELEGEEAEELEGEELAGDVRADLSSGIPGIVPGQPHVVSAPDEEEEPGGAAGGGRGGRRRGGAEDDFGGDGGGGEPPSGALVPEPRAFPGNRLVNFMRGSWRELQRVQWPDRRQVVQATGVVIGFVIVAGMFLGGADWVAGKLITFLLK